MKSSIVIIAAALLFSAVGGVVVYKARGIRNNNPGNIRRGAAWQGMRRQQTDASFVQFMDAKFGIRALNKVLRTYAERYGLNTVRGIIARWAPDSENDTLSYIGFVAAALDVHADQVIDVQAYAPALTRAIIKHENGVQPYSDATIRDGVMMGWS